MADPLSVAGSIAGLISLGDTVFRKLYHYIKDVKSAEKEVQDLKDEVAALNGVLHNLHIVAQDLEADGILNYSIRLDHINSCLSTLYKLDEKLKSTGISDKGKLRNTIHKLAWPFKATNAKEFIKDVHQHRANLNFALSADNMTALLKCLSKQDNISQQITDINTRLRDKQNIETRIALDNERRRILGHFLFVDPNESFQTSLKLRYPTTGFWLTENKTFSKWLRRSGTHLWLSGIPGAGKTVLSSLVIQSCMARITTKRAMAFFYCDYKNPHSHKISNLLGTLASQLARQNEESFQLLKTYYETLNPQHQLKRGPEVEELVQLLQDMSATFEDVRIIVDGLDECGNNAGEASNVLKSIASGQDTISLGMLSRDEQDIREELGSPFCDYIEIAAHTKDLDHYVRSEIEGRIRSGRLRLRSTNIKEEIVNQLVSRAQGMFRWVSCQLDHLCELPTDALRRKALTQLPSTLYETYDRVLMRVKEPVIPLVRRALQWIAYASPKLIDNELTEIVSIGEDDEALDPEAYPDVEDLLRSCGSLIRRGHKSLELAHFTVQEFLEAIKPDDERLNQFRLNAAHRLTLAKTCVTYLCLPSFDRPPPITYVEYEDRDEDHPFYGHVSYYLPEYLSGYLDNPNLLERLQKLFHPKETYNLTCFMLRHLFEKLMVRTTDFDRFINNVCTHGFGPLHAAAMLHMDRLCQWLIDQGCDVNQESPMGSPLECAVFSNAYTFDSSMINGQHLSKSEAKNTIALLLDAGAFCDKKTIHDVSLSYVALLGPVDLSSPFANLLDHGMPLQPDAIALLGRPQTNIDIGELMLTVNRSWNKISPEIKIELLELAQARNISTSSEIPSSKSMSAKFFFEAITYTIDYDQIDAFKELTRDRRFSVDMTHPERPGTLLHLAAIGSAIPIMNLLLDLGFDPAKTGAEGRTVLHDVAKVGIEDQQLQRRLIASESAEFADEHGRTAWHEAAARGRYRMLELLLEKYGPDPPWLRGQSKAGHTPLLEAIINKKSDCALLLLKAHNADQTLFDDQRILQYTVANGLHDFLKELFCSGADLCAVSKQERTVLYFLTSATTLETLDFLYSHGLDPNHCDTSGKSPLVAFLARDNRVNDLKLAGIGSLDSNQLDESMVEKLTTTSSVSCKDTDGRTAWFYFCTRTIPFVLGHEMKARQQYLTCLLSILVRNGAHSAYEKHTTLSGVALLVDMSLNLAESTYVEGVVAILLINALSIAMGMEAFIGHPQLIRLLLWSVVESERPLIRRLLNLGINVHLTSASYQGMTAIDMCCIHDVDPDILHLLLENADVSLLSKPNKNGQLAFHRFCSPSVSCRPRRSIAKLEAFLKAGVNPDARSLHLRTAAHVAAKAGFLEALQLLVRFHADLRLTDRYGWSAIQFATGSGDTNMLTYLREQLQENHEWTTTFSLQGKPHSPLGARRYLNCNLLHLAAACGSSEVLQFFKEISCFDDLDAQTQEGVTPLHFAVCTDQPEATRWLISNGANINAVLGAKHKTALHLACRAGALENILCLVEAGAVFLSDRTGCTPELEVDPDIRASLLLALPHCEVPIPPTILENLERGYKLQSAGGLHKAIAEGDLEACQSVIQSGRPLDQSAMECGTCTPLIVALAEEELDIVDLFLGHGTSTAGLPCPLIQSKGPMFDSALNITISKPTLNTRLERLLELSLKHEDHWAATHSFYQPLHLAAAFNPEGIDILFDHVRAYDSLLTKKRGYGSYLERHSDFVLTLLDSHSGPETDIWLAPGGTALHVATSNKNLDAIDKLLSYGADVNSQDVEGRTPLHIAAYRNCTASAKKLLQHGATLRFRDSALRTPLMIACMTGAVEMIHLLVDHKMDRTIVDYDGKTALHYSAQYPEPKVFIDLLDAGWDPYQLDNSGRSSIYYALSNQPLATYIYAKGLDLTQLISNKEAYALVPLSAGRSSLRCFNRRFPEPARNEYLNRQAGNRPTLLINLALSGEVQNLHTLIHAGADVEVCNRNVGTALIAACQAGQLSSVKFLVRYGAKLDCLLNGCTVNAVQAARGNHKITNWFLVERYLDQGKIKNGTTGDEENAELRFWSGIRQVEIPLRGPFERPMGWSLLEYASYLHEITEDWRRLVPLSWDSVAHFTPLLGEQ